MSLIDNIELSRIQEMGNKTIPTLPVNNIVLIGATGRQNKTVRKQVMLELNSNGKTITMEFLVAHGLPFTMLIGCDMLRKYSAIIDMSRAKVTLDSNCINWTAKLMESESAISDRTVYNIQEIRNHRWHMPSNHVFYQNDDDQLWREKLQEIYTFKHDKTSAPVSYTHLDVYKRQGSIRFNTYK